MKISGEFEVNMNPLESTFEASEGTQMGRFSLEKVFRGGLSATSRGEMLTATTGVKGSAGYVALEQVSGELNGKTGSFVLQHYGIMARGQDRLLLEVVPDSGAGALKGLTGKMTISLREGRHSYEFDYEFDS